MKKWLWAAMAVLVAVFVLAAPVMAFAQDDAIAVTDYGGVVDLVGSALFVVAAVNALKKLYGFSGQGLAGVAMLLGVGLQILLYYFGDSDLFVRIMTGVIYGGGAAGLWVLSSRSSPEV